MVKTGIIPLILVESVLIAVYLISNRFISSDNMEYIYTKVNEELKISSEREAAIIREKLLSIENLNGRIPKQKQNVFYQKNTPLTDLKR